MLNFQVAPCHPAPFGATGMYVDSHFPFVHTGDAPGAPVSSTSNSGISGMNNQTLFNWVAGLSLAAWGVGIFIRASRN
jgi:hypothetical protein